MWFFSALLFSVLISAGQFLFELIHLVSDGAPAYKVAQLAMLIFPGILAKSFPMGMLLATLLAFGRLSGDSEIVALRAAGISVGRIMAPVAALGLAVALLTFTFNERVVPRASSTAIRIRTGMEESLHKSRQQSASQPFFDGDRLIGFINATDVDLSTQTLRDVTIVSLDPDRNVQSVLQADNLQYTDIHDWKVVGKATIYFVQSKMRVEVAEGAWPQGATKPKLSLDDIITRTLRDLDVYDMREMAERIESLRADPNHDKGELSNLEFGYWNKIAVPLGALVFGLLGAPMGIRNHRSGAATGFALSIIIIFGYVMVTNVLAVMSRGGLVPAWAASFVPVGVGMVAAAVLIRRKNVL